MREVVFTLEKGKEVPDRLNGTEIRYTLPETPEECLAVCGGDKDVFVSVFNEGFNLNHRQKIAKRFAARDGSTVESIKEGVANHKPGVRAAGTGERKAPSQRKQAITELESMVAAMPAEQQAEFRKRLEALKPVKKAKAEGETTAPVATEGNTAPPVANGAQNKGGNKQK